MACKVKCAQNNLLLSPQWNVSKIVEEPWVSQLCWCRTKKEKRTTKTKQNKSKTKNQLNILIQTTQQVWDNTGFVWRQENYTRHAPWRIVEWWVGRFTSEIPRWVKGWEERGLRRVGGGLTSYCEDWQGMTTLATRWWSGDNKAGHPAEHRTRETNGQNQPSISFNLRIYTESENITTSATEHPSEFPLEGTNYTGSAFLKPLWPLYSWQFVSDFHET